MTTLLPALRESLRTLCPGRSHALRLALLMLIGTALPLAEMLLAALFSSVITNGRDAVSGLWWQVVLFFALFLAIRATHYAQRTYRVTYLEKALAVSADTSPRTESWRWAQGMEVLGVLGASAQLLALAVLFLVVSPTFGAVSLAVLALVMQAVGMLFRSQSEQQLAFRTSTLERTPVPTSQRVRSRVVAAESGSLASAFGAAVQLGALVALFALGRVDVGTTIVLFFGVRLQTTLVSALSGSVMRLARAQAQVAA